jgi:copper chaperone CopZ
MFNYACAAGKLEDIFMMRLARIAGVFVFLIGCSRSAEQAQPVVGAEERPAKVMQTAFNAEGSPTIQFSVPDMMCEDSCVPQVRKTLAQQPGVKDVKVELATHTATVAVDQAKFNADAAVAALVDLQFTNTKLATDAAPTAATPEAPHSSEAGQEDEAPKS